MSGSMAKRFVIKICLSWAILALIPRIVVACPNCKTAVDQSNDMMVHGFGISILLMLMIPTLIVAFWGVAIVVLRHSTLNAV